MPQGQYMRVVWLQHCLDVGSNQVLPTMTQLQHRLGAGCNAIGMRVAIECYWPSHWDTQSHLCLDGVATKHHWETSGEARLQSRLDEAKCIWVTLEDFQKMLGRNPIRPSLQLSSPGCSLVWSSLKGKEKSCWNKAVKAQNSLLNVFFGISSFYN